MATYSEDGVKFGLGNPNTDSNKQREENNTPAETPAAPAQQGVDAEDLEQPYTDERGITIALVTNYSLFRKSNDKVLPKRQDYIGSSVYSSRTLTSNKEEMEAYMPNIIGISPNNENFVTRVKQYFNNIRIGVDSLGKTFNNSFRYYHKKDYLAIKKVEDEIEARYNSIDRSDSKALKEALIRKITELNTLESTKHKYGYPINVEDYLMYRHCLLYNSVAKELAFINSDTNIRFYFKDNKKEEERKAKYRLEVNKAKTNYVSCLADDELFDAVYIQYCVLRNLSIVSSLNQHRLDREIELDKFSNDEPVKFNKIFANKDIKLMAMIEKLISRGELTQYRDNQNILTNSGEFIGANMKEAVIWFKDPNNAKVVAGYKSKLKLF